MTRAAQDRLTDIQTAIRKVYQYRACLNDRAYLNGQHADMAISAILRAIGIIRRGSDRAAGRTHRQTARDRLAPDRGDAELSSPLSRLTRNANGPRISEVQDFDNAHHTRLPRNG